MKGKLSRGHRCTYGRATAGQGKLSVTGGLVCVLPCLSVSEVCVLHLFALAYWVPCTHAQGR